MGTHNQSVTAAGQVNRKEWPHPRLHVGKQEVEPIEAAQRSPRRERFRRDGRLGLGCSLHFQFGYHPMVRHRREVVTIALSISGSRVSRDENKLGAPRCISGGYEKGVASLLKKLLIRSMTRHTTSH